MRCKQTAKAIVSYIPASWDGCVIEVGPGTGALTEFLVQQKSFHKVVAFEIEKDTCITLQKRFCNVPTFTVIEQDFLQANHTHLPGGGDTKHIFIGNLPYNRAAQIIFHCLEQFFHQTRQMIFTIQWEVAQRFASNVGDKHYSKAGVVAQFFCQKIALMGERINPQAFWPTPQVYSQTISFITKDSLPLGVDYSRFKELVRGGFGWRRKKIGKALFCACKTESLEKEKIEILLNQYPQIREKRGEELSHEMYIEMATKYEQIC